MSSFFKKWGLVFVLVWLMVYSRDLLVPCALLGGEAPTVPVCCHSLGKGHCAVARKGGIALSEVRVGLSVPPCVPRPCGWAQSPAVSGWDSGRSSRGAPRSGFQSCPSFPLPHPKGAAPAAFPRNRATLGLSLVLLL